jgi:hypothetical protein
VVRVTDPYGHILGFLDRPFLYLSIPKATKGLEPISYSGAPLTTLLHATVYMFLHNLLNVIVQIANKMGLQKNIYRTQLTGLLGGTASPTQGLCVHTVQHK